jgi:hypothetical protein
MLPLLLVMALDWKAEFCGHSIPHNGTTYFTDRHLVIEVEILPDKGSPLRLASGDFQLRVNGRKELLPSESPGMVAAGLKYSDWNTPTQLQAQAGPVILGAPRQEPRFPGDNRTGVPNRVPQTETIEKAPVKTDAEAVIDAALPEGPTLGPTKGLVYFPYRGKMKSIKSVEILWGERTLKLR